MTVHRKLKNAECMQGRIQDFQKGGAHPDTTLARKVIMYVRAPRVHVVIRAAPCREQSGDETI